MVNIPQNTHYSTIDTALAAYLLINGVELVSISPPDIDRGPYAFIFDDTAGVARNLSGDFRHRLGSAKVIREFFDTYKGLLNRVKGNG